MQNTVNTNAIANAVYAATEHCNYFVCMQLRIYALQSANCPEIEHLANWYAFLFNAELGEGEE